MRSMVALLATALVTLAASEASAQSLCAGEIVTTTGSAVRLAGFRAEDLAAAVLAERPILILGERHGVEAHPRAGACLLSLLGDVDKRLVVEMLGEGGQQAIATRREKYPETASGLGVDLAWASSGWPEWRIYLPLFDAAWISRSAVVAGDPPEEATRDGERIAAARQALGPAADPAQRSWRAGLAEAMCGLASDEHLAAAAEAQMVRDARMAERLGEAGADVVPILYAGRAHARRDRSVPLHLLRTAERRPIVSVALWEDHDADGPVDRARVIAEAAGRFDAVWFVGTADGTSLCRGLGRVATGGVASPPPPAASPPRGAP